MSETKWREKHIWTFKQETFSVVIQHWTEEVPREGEAFFYRPDGGHRWNVYAYFYPAHPHFAKFRDDSMFQEAALCVPIHGHSFLGRHLNAKGEIGAIQVGGDYNHLGDDMYTTMGVDEFQRIERDAIELIDWCQKGRGE